MIHFSNTYLDLPSDFYKKVDASHFPDPKLIAYNQDLSKKLGLSLENLNPQELALYFSGQKQFPGSANIALNYSGHQFGQLNPRLGDGRALLIGELLTDSGERFDIQMKGSGPTPYSRGGDGKSALGPVLREYLMSEAMYALGVKTTRSLAAVLTGENVYRERELPGAVVTRVAQSHIRIGTFEYFAVRKDLANLKTLFHYTLNRHYSEISQSDLSEEDKILCFFKCVGEKIIDLVSNWMSLGFIHGVMNTDNMSIAAETIDYGPCAFMHSFNPDQVYSSIDVRGRYRYSQQLNIALWNLSVLAQCLIPLLSCSESDSIMKFEALLANLQDQAKKIYTLKMLNKIGLQEITSLNEELLSEYMQFQSNQMEDYTGSFAKLTVYFENPSKVPNVLKQWFTQIEKIWFKEKSKTLFLLQKSNPLRIPRNDLIELAIEKAYMGDYSHFMRLHEIFKTPYTDTPIPEIYQIQNAIIPDNYKTFCGT